MILTNLDHVKGAEVKESLGLAFGYAAVISTRKGKRVLQMEKEHWPWADTPDHFEALFREAEKRIVGSAQEMGADAVIRIEAKLSRDPQGNPEMLLVGSAVKIDATIGPGSEAATSDGTPAKEKGEGIHVTIDGRTAEWEMDQTTARKDILSLLRQRDQGGEARKGPEKGPEEGVKDLQALAEVMGISFERAQQLDGAGLSSPETIARADLKVLLAIPNMNPTQARIIKARALELAAGK